MHSHRTFLIGCLIFFVFTGCNNRNSSNSTIINSDSQIPLINYSVSNSFLHDTSLFTEGFLFYNGRLFESTGSPDDLFQTKSMIGTDDLSTGKFDKKIEIDKRRYFGEGIVFFKNKLYQLTYKNHLCFVYDAKTFKLLDSLNYSNSEGWSLTSDDTNLIMSDGTDKLTYVSANDFKPVKVLTVTENEVAVDSLNELEYIHGFIYANVWQTNSIVKINTSNGKVVGKLDLASLVLEAKNKNPAADVLNGIAYDSGANKIYVTGKLWSNIYEVNFTH